MNLLGRLGWDALPLGQPIPMIASAAVALGILAVLAWVNRRLLRIPVARVADQRRPQAHRR